MQDVEARELVRFALGKVGFIGELYNAKTESLTSRNLFKDEFPSKFVRVTSISNTSFNYKFTENLSDRFDLLGIEGEIQVPLLCGFLEAGGCGKFLREEKKTTNSVTCSLLCKFQTICEKLFVSFEDILGYLDLSALEDSEYTHVLVEINWGANCVANFQQKFSSDFHKKEIEGLFDIKIKKLIKFLSLKFGVDGKCNDGNELKQNDVKINVIADVIPEGILPTTIESFCQFLSKIPNSLKNLNEGKGIPLTYKMIPLLDLRKTAGVLISANSIVRTIDESFLYSVVCLFEEISVKKEKLHDLVSDMQEFECYLPDEDLKNAKKQVESLTEKETQLKNIITKYWVSVKSGQKPLRELIRSVERFRARDLNLFECDEYLNNAESIRNKITMIKNYTSRGVEYLKKGKLFTNELGQNVGFEFIILLVSKTFDGLDAALYSSTCHYFLSLVGENLANTKYVVIDLDTDTRIDDKVITNRSFFAKLGVTNSRCMHFKRGQVLNSDLYETYLWEKKNNIARVKTGVDIELVHHRPGNRISLEMTCPGHSSNGCSSEKVQWHCSRCKQLLEYGFDKYFYCSCGRVPVNEYEYRCSCEAHGISFFPAGSKFISDELSALRALKELNILVLGQTGVGKSTWINSIVNYLSYESLDQAKENGVICTIPIKFSTYDRETSERQDVVIGDVDTAGEITEAGKSGTQFCSTYSFHWQGRIVRIIDTPGIGDTRGINQDKENMKSIIDHLCHLKELHGICILMKANESRVNAIFSYCLKELLVNMHKSVAKNIVFCFTNARNSFYTPGQTSVLLEKQLESLHIEKELSLGHYNRFCLDNEAFLFLCTLKYPNIRHDEILSQSFAQSWEISLKETLRLFTTIKNFKPHILQNTRSLFTARTKILFLSRPIAEISKTIQINLAAIAKKKREMAASEETLQQLSQKLYYSEIHLEPVPLEIPRTVCTAPKCVRYHKIEGVDITDIEYVTHCHKICYIKEVVPKAINNALLKKCSVMDENGKCEVCDCEWSSHMHITFDQKRVEKQGVNKQIERDFLREKSEKEKSEEFMRTLQAKTDKYENEQNFIIQVSVKFGMFLKENAISVYNDAISDYLKYLINEEENKPFKTSSEEELLKKLKETLKHYEAEIGILEEVVRKGEKETAIPTIDEIDDLEQKLYALEMSGADMKKYADINRSTSSALSSYTEIPLQIRTTIRDTANEGNTNIFKRIWRKVWPL